MRPILVTPSTETVVTLRDAAIALRLDPEDPPNDLQQALDAALAAIEGNVGALARSEWRIAISRFPCADYIPIPAYNVTSIDDLVITAASGDGVDFGGWYEDLDALPSRLMLQYGSTWPSVILRPSSGVVVHYTAGWTAVNIPADLKKAVLLETGHLYEHRESVLASTMSYPGAIELPRGVESLISRYKWPYAQALEALWKLGS